MHRNRHAAVRQTSRLSRIFATGLLLLGETLAEFFNRDNLDFPKLGEGRRVTSHIDPDRLSLLIGLIYDAALDTACWPVAMEAIRIELNCANAALALQTMPDGAFILHLNTNIPKHYEKRMAGYAADVMEQWGGVERMMTLPMDEPHILSRINPAAIDPERTVNRYTIEWALPQNLHDVLAIGLARDAAAIGSLAFGRRRDAGPFEARELAIARLLIPHLQRAATINRLLEAAALARATLEATIDTLSVAITLVDERMRILFANAAARTMLTRGDPIHNHQGKLGATGQPASRALQVAVAQASTDAGALGRRGLGIPVYRNSEASVLYVLPLRTCSASPSHASVAVFVSDTATPFVPPTELVAALFGLTPAESRVFQRIAGGESLAETAAALEVQSSTVKTHLNAVYEKTGVRRRAGLQRIASALVLPVAVG
ncbi:helix-turn-helix transcriptional regulator [Sphingomonas sp. BAUL-RG-20F-R05-02]|uniref:helix-turn-helix transcriptional regulator n=1 Tax=Sphingomonas sp. BAUL-RG-20F-R05-02 TaxID=2914830 RepID=UPI001F574464|nr:helix-turn-helix transcriptional regulator [Sphingomonas sp. BAUL-RG-20F-R05-02]